ncbi:alpha-L-fucosidase [Rubrolithibacter danxiaensis]|uniref:alpha-L-fucosidase n=1 Tax=Rubrolithibacter danxiaensis TaxID=3390805 RepID=UPI003BF87367
MRKKLFSGLILLSVFTTSVSAQPNVHSQSTKYEWPSEPEVREKLDKWQDQKFGMIIHWGVYSVPGMIESWALCSEDWIERDSTLSYGDFKKWYWGLSKSFNPVKFNPEQWARAGKDAGMRYMVFTTKHHDGFNMFDTKETDYKITNGPFKKNPRADVAKYVFEAFRKQDFMIGAYFSKPDWHCEYFWWPKYATPNRNVNYDIRKYPDRWNKYKQFTYNQLSELMHNYGSVDVLWLDGGWVRPKETVNEEVLSWGAPIPEFSQEIDMPKIASMAREAQPGILIVDRTVHGPYENYQTPEQTIPKKQLNNPWESCMTLGNAWGFVPNDQYKSAARVIQSLIEVTAKGGSLLLGIGPKADGTLPEEVVNRLEEIGRWMKVNGEAIYNTRITEKYHEGNTWFTQSKNGNTKYALICIPEGQSTPPVVEWTGNSPEKGAEIKFLQTGKPVKWKKEGEKVKIWLPKSVRNTYTPALAFSINTP